MTKTDENAGKKKGFRYGPDFYLERDFLRALDEMLDRAAKARGSSRPEMFGPRGDVFNLGRFLRSYECQYGKAFFVPKATLRSLLDCKDKVIQRVHAGLKWGGFILDMKSGCATFPDDYGRETPGPVFFYQLAPTPELLTRLREHVLPSSCHMVSSDSLQGDQKRSVLTSRKVSFDHVKEFVWSFLTNKLESFPKKRKGDKSGNGQAYLDRSINQKDIQTYKEVGSHRTRPLSKWQKKYILKGQQCFQ